MKSIRVLFRDWSLIDVEMRVEQKKIQLVLRHESSRSTSLFMTLGYQVIGILGQAKYICLTSNAYFDDLAALDQYFRK